jgi:hypothetical protein
LTPRYESSFSAFGLDGTGHVYDWLKSTAVLPRLTSSRQLEFRRDADRRLDRPGDCGAV